MCIKPFVVCHLQPYRFSRFRRYKNILRNENIKVLAYGFALSVIATAAYAAPYTYVFTGFVEHLPGGGTTRPEKYGKLVVISIKVNPDAPGKITNNGKVYGGTYFNAADPADPIMSATIDGHIFNEGGYDTLSISRATSGQYSIYIQHYEPQVGEYSFSFTTSFASSQRSLAKPDRLVTLNFETSTFEAGFAGNPGIYESGAIVTR